MNSDKMTTIMGVVMAAITALGTFMAPAGTPGWQQAIGYVGAVAMGVWGYLTNKHPGT